MCSTPQKHPAATVAFSVPSGTETAPGPSGPKRMVDDVKGRDRRAKREFMIGGVRIATAMRMMSVSGFVVAVESSVDATGSEARP
jgi:hypothetical protein